MRTIIIGNGSIANYDIVREYFDGAYIIACDGGLRHCRAMMITPNVMVGDFDSALSSDIAFYEELGVLKTDYPRRKDMTDMEIALNMALEKDTDEIYIVGGLGTRFDHSLANVHILINTIRQGVRTYLLDEHNIITLVEDSIEIVGDIGQVISLIPLTTEVTGIESKNLEYPLYNRTMTIGSSLGISNVMTAEKASISVKSGILIVIMSKE